MHIIKITDLPMLSELHCPKKQLLIIFWEEHESSHGLF